MGSGHAQIRPWAFFQSTITWEPHVWFGQTFFLCNQGLNTILLVPHKAMLGIMATGCIIG